MTHVYKLSNCITIPKPVWSFDTACSTGSSTCTTKHVKKHCYNQRLGTAKYASWAIAKAACAANSNCFGVYDAGCRKSSIYLCDSRKITSSAKLSNSGSSCVFEKPNAGSVVAAQLTKIKTKLQNSLNNIKRAWGLR